MKKFLCMALTFAMLLGCAAAFSGCGADSNTINIGLIGPYTGDTAQYGLAVRNGAQLYFDEVNAAGGVNGKMIKYTAYDNKGDSTEAVTAFNRLVDEGMHAFLGDVLTGTTLAIVGEAYAINMPMITASATAEAVTVNPDTKAVYTNVFRTCFLDPYQGKKMADYASEKVGAKTAAVIFNTDDDYSIGLKDAFIAECAVVGIDVLASEGYAKDDKDFKAQLTNISSKNPDVVFCPNYYEDDALIVTQARQVGIKAPFLGGDGWGGVTKYASAEDLEGSVYSSGYDASSETGKEFEAKYLAKYGETVPNMFAALAYDAAKVLVNAISVVENQKDASGNALKAGSAEYKQAVIDAIRDNSGSVQGVTSNGYRFDEFNNPAKSVVLTECVDGAEVSKGLY